MRAGQGFGDMFYLLWYAVVMVRGVVVNAWRRPLGSAIKTPSCSNLLSLYRFVGVLLKQ